MSSPFPIPARDRSRIASDISFRTTCKPLIRETCAIPLPIWPAPRTPIFETLIPSPNEFVMLSNDYHNNIQVYLQLLDHHGDGFSPADAKRGDSEPLSPVGHRVQE